MFIHRSLCGALAVSALLAAGAARADLAPSVPPECVGKPAGTPCTLDNGTAGVCQTQTDSRRPGRSYTICTRDEHECDRLTVGAACKGYLGKPAHCKEFSNAEGKRWRTCQADENEAAAPSPLAAAAAPPSPAPAAAAAAPPGSTPAAAPPAPAASSRGAFGCVVVPGAVPAQLTGPGGLVAALLGALGLSRARRRARQS